jgi:hypothetical protein
MTTAISEFTGQPVDTTSEAWRFECECAHVLRMPTRLARNAFIEGISQKRGDEAAKQLRNGVTMLWEIRKEKQQA